MMLLCFWKILRPLPVAAVALLTLAGCEMMRTAESSSSPWGKPVVELASVTEATGPERDLLPETPFNLPAYPPHLLQGGAEGYVDVRVHLKDDGSVKDAGVVKSTDKAFESSVVSSVKSWRFPSYRPAVASTANESKREPELICRIRFSIQQTSRGFDSAGDFGNSRDKPADLSGAPTRDHEMTGR